MKEEGGSKGTTVSFQAILEQAQNARRAWERVDYAGMKGNDETRFS
jgi:hypothetical protein